MTDMEGGGGGGGERSRPLHNFTLPPRLSWGAQRLLRCSNDTSPSSSSLQPDTKRFRSSCSSTPANLMIDLGDKMRAAFLGEEAARPPWSLRTRRGGGEVIRSGNDEEAFAREGGEREREREKFKVGLTRQEVEEDFYVMVGRRPPRKPKKRPRYVQKNLNTLFPGLWLSEITADMYKVNDTPESAK